jgi:hypothetical protein
MASEVTAYKCDFCHRCFGRLNNARIHEAACKNNPERRQCITCIHGTRDAIQVEREHAGFDSISYTYHSAPYCAHHNNTPIHEKPYFIDCDLAGGYDTGFGWIKERPIPGTCEYYEYKGKPGWTKREREETKEEREKTIWP